MPASDVLELELMDLIFLNLDFDNIGDSAGIQASAAPGTITLALSTGTLGETSTQATTEAAYTSYARIALVRSAADWSNAAGVVTNDNIEAFPAATGGSETETDVSLGSDQVADEMWLYGVLDSGLAVSNGITPQFAASALDITLT